MIVIAIAAVMCGADGWVAVAQFGRSKETRLREFLALPNGIPSHDTFGRVLSLLQPEAFEDCFRSWVALIREVIPGEIIAADGKTLRRSHDRTAGLAALHRVSAWAAASRVVLGQVATEAKSNEITATRSYWRCCASRAALSPSTRWAVRPKLPSRSSNKEGDYVLALKGNL